MTREEAVVVLKAFMENPLFSDVHKVAFNIAIHDIKQRHDWDINKLMLVPKTEWEHDHEILKAYSDGVNEILDKLRAEIKNKIIKKPNLDFKTWERERNEAFLEVLDILDKYKTESEDNNA